MYEPANEQPNAGVHESIVVRDLVELTLAAALLSHQNEQLDQQVDREKGDVRPPDDRVAKQINAIVIAREELALWLDGIGRSGMGWKSGKNFLLKKHFINV